MKFFGFLVLLSIIGLLFVEGANNSTGNKFTNSFKNYMSTMELTLASALKNPNCTDSIKNHVLTSEKHETRTNASFVNPKKIHRNITANSSDPTKYNRDPILTVLNSLLRTPGKGKNLTVVETNLKTMNSWNNTNIQSPYRIPDDNFPFPILYGSLALGYVPFDTMATKRGEQSRLELTDFYSKKENDYIEKQVLPTDTLQGIALQYNTTVSELKKLNNLHTDAALYAHRTVKVPARGILINLEPDTVPILLPPVTNEEEEEVEANGQTYLNNIDETLNEIREKAKNATANSVVAAMDTPLTIPPSRSQSELKWWKVFLPCLGTLIVFPILYFFYRQHLTSGNDVK